MRLSASAMAMLPSLVAGTELNTPLKLPIGVRTALTMTACCFLFTGFVSVSPFEMALNFRRSLRAHDITSELT
jgi:hypothetical protein